MAQFKNEREEKAFIREWEKTRLDILTKLNGRVIIITCEGKEQNGGYGFINRSRSETSD